MILQRGGIIIHVKKKKTVDFTPATIIEEWPKRNVSQSGYVYYTIPNYELYMLVNRAVTQLVLCTSR